MTFRTFLKQQREHISKHGHCCSLGLFGVRRSGGACDPCMRTKESEVGQDLNSSDQARIEWCAEAVRQIADLGRDKPLGDLYPLAVQVLGALHRVLEPNVE